MTAQQKQHPAQPRGSSVMTLQAINKEWYHTLYCSNSIKITWEQRNRASSYSENGELEYQVKDTHQSMPTCAAHLRDTRKTRLYPSVNAITAFAFAARVCFCLDFLCFVVFYSKSKTKRNCRQHCCRVLMFVRMSQSCTACCGHKIFTRDP